MAFRTDIGCSFFNAHQHSFYNGAGSHAARCDSVVPWTERGETA